MSEIDEKLAAARKGLDERDDNKVGNGVLSKGVIGLVTLFALSGGASQLQAQNDKGDNDSGSFNKTTIDVGFSNITATEITSDGNTIFFNDFSPSVKINQDLGSGFHAGLDAQYLIITRNDGKPIDDADWQVINSSFLISAGKKLGDKAQLEILGGRTTDFAEYFAATPNLGYATETRATPYLNMRDQLFVRLKAGDTKVDVGFVGKPGDNSIMFFPNMENASLYAGFNQDITALGYKIRLGGSVQLGQDGKFEQATGSLSANTEDRTSGITLGAVYNAKNHGIHGIARMFKEINKDWSIIAQGTVGETADRTVFDIDIGAARKKMTQVSMHLQAGRNTPTTVGVNVSHRMGCNKRL